MPTATPLPYFPFHYFNSKKMIRGHRIIPYDRKPFFVKNKDILTYNNSDFSAMFFKKNGVWFFLDIKNAPSKY